MRNDQNSGIGWSGLLMGVVCGLAPAASLHAAVISYLGRDVDTKADWRKSSVAKSDVYDVDEDNIYGTDGYHVFTTDSANTGSGKAVPVSSQPAYIGSMSFVQTANYSSINFPQFNKIDLTGNVSVGVSQPPGLGQVTPGTEVGMYTFTLDEDRSSFVLGIVQGWNAGIAGQGRLRQTVGGSADSGYTTLSPNPTSTLNYVFYNFYQIDGGKAGDTFVFSIKNDTTGNRTPLLTGVTFDTVVPEPVTFTGVAGMTSFFLLMRRRLRA